MNKVLQNKHPLNLQATHCGFIKNQLWIEVVIERVVKNMTL